MLFCVVSRVGRPVSGFGKDSGRGSCRQDEQRVGEERDGVPAAGPVGEAHHQGAAGRRRPAHPHPQRGHNLRRAGADDAAGVPRPAQQHRRHHHQVQGRGRRPHHHLRQLRPGLRGAVQPHPQAAAARRRSEGRRTEPAAVRTGERAAPRAAADPGPGEPRPGLAVGRVALRCPGRF